MRRSELAVENFKKGLNCSQSVVLAFKDLLSVNEGLLKKASICFGGGLGRQRLTCGAVAGMCMVISILKSDGEDKLANYAIIQSACKEFTDKVGSIICADLLEGNVKVETSPVPDARTAEYYKKRPCAELCAIAVEIAEKYI